MKTGLNYIKKKTYITASLESTSFSKRFPKFESVRQDYHYSLRKYGLLNHTGSAVFYMTLLTLASMF